MKCFIKLFALLLAVTVCLTSCSDISLLTNQDSHTISADSVSQATNTSKQTISPSESTEIIFAHSSEGDLWNKRKHIGTTEIAEYESPYEDCMSDFYKSKLKAQNKEHFYVYNALKYAIDNCYEYIYIPESLCSYTDLTTIAEYLSCDSPFLEHNYSDDGIVHTGKANIATTDGAKYSVCYLNLTKVSTDYLAKKVQAYKTAKKSVENMPTKYTTEYEKALYLYQLVVQNVKYADTSVYDYNTVPIYDALCTAERATICDGYTDTVTMLFNLAGIKCFGVKGITNSTAKGHAWNIALIDGKYYNLDATNDATFWSGGNIPSYYFLFSETLLSKYVTIEKDFKDFVPRCPFTDMEEKSANISISGEYDTTNISTAANFLLNNGIVCVKYNLNLPETTIKNISQNIQSQTNQTLNYTIANSVFYIYTLNN